MIDERRLLNWLRSYQFENYAEVLYEKEYNFIESLIKRIENEPKASEWIPCSERLPEERDSIFKKFKGTNKWNDAMFETISDKVNVTIEFENGKRMTDTSNTIEGKWRCEKEYSLNTKVIAWMPLPESYKEDNNK